MGNERQRVRRYPAMPLCRTLTKSFGTVNDDRHRDIRFDSKRAD